MPGFHDDIEVIGALWHRVRHCLPAHAHCAVAFLQTDRLRHYRRIARSALQNSALVFPIMNAVVTENFRKNNYLA